MPFLSLAIGVKALEGFLRALLSQIFNTTLLKYTVKHYIFAASEFRDFGM